MFMSAIKIKSKNNSGIDKKPRVFFTCHPDDFEKHFEKICEDIFKFNDCAIYYTENLSELIEETDKETIVARSNLIVVPVTLNLLTTPNRAMDEDIPYALQMHIPVLPIMMGAGIDSIYSRPDKFGSLQYLNPNSGDLTEISYEDKLKKHLETILVSPQKAEAIRSAFDAYIFLSYRKKDRRYANELMRMIHKNPKCRNIAIWFDEFLTPGESFKGNIDSVLSNSNLFALLVTPNLLEEPDGKPNYVMGVEYKAAKSSGIDIFPAEMAETDRSSLDEKFEGLPPCVCPYNKKDFDEKLLNCVSKFAPEPDNIPEHDYLIGLAYLEGIDVEVDRERALELITSAAEAGVSAAMEKLYNMYNEGIGVAIDYAKAAKWAKAYYEFMLSKHGEKDPLTLTSLHDLAYIYGKMGNRKAELEIMEKVYADRREVLGDTHEATLTSMNNLAVTYIEMHEYEKALEINKKSYRLCCESLGENHPKTLGALNTLACNYSFMGNNQKALMMHEDSYKRHCEIYGEDSPETLVSLSNLASTYSEIGEYETAQIIQERVYESFVGLLGEKHPDTMVALSRLADIHGKLHDFETEHKLAKKVYSHHCEIFGEEHPNSLNLLKHVAISYGHLGKLKKQLELNSKAYDLCCKLLGKEHPDTILTLNNLACSYGETGKKQKELELEKEAYEACCKVMGEESALSVTLLNNLATTYGELRLYDEELALQEKAYNLSCNVLGKEHPTSITILKNLGDAYLDHNELSKALNCYEESYVLHLLVLGEEHPYTLSLCDRLSSIYEQTDDWDKYFKTHELAYHLNCHSLGEEHPDTLVSLSKLLNFYASVGYYEKALEFAQKAYIIHDKLLGAEHPATIEISEFIEELKKIINNG